jgi:hypothetical protein
LTPRYLPQKTKQQEKSTLYIRDIEYSQPLDKLKEDLKVHLSQFGEIETIQVN